MNIIKLLKDKLRGPKWLILLFAIVFLGFGAQSAKLTCRHHRETELVSCIKQSYLLWVVPLSTIPIDDVRGAQVNESYNDESGATYRVDLLTSHGQVPVNYVYTSSYSTKRDIADQINAFVKSTSAPDLVVKEPGLLSAENLICTGIWIPLVWAINNIWKALKSEPNWF